MSNINRRTAGSALLLALTSGGCAGVATSAGTIAAATAAQPLKRNTMSTDNPKMTTHCLGRYLVDVPADAGLKAGFTYADGKIETRLNVLQSDFERLIAAREAKLKSTQHSRGGDMFVGRTELSNTKVLLISWNSHASKILQAYESFSYSPINRALFLRSSVGTAASQAGNIESQTRVASSYRYREADEIPNGAGFCINSGMFAADVLNKEEYNASIALKGHPNVGVTLQSYVTGNPDKELLDRMGGIPGVLAAALSAASTLRRGNHNIGPVKGQEFLVRSKEDGNNHYQFLWESQGKVDSIEFPFMSLSLNTNLQAGAPSSIKSDEEALKIWDSILDTLRLRPGAV